MEDHSRKTSPIRQWLSFRVWLGRFSWRLGCLVIFASLRPRYRDGKHGEADKLAGCYRHSLELAVAHKVRAIAFPAISCGIYGYPIADAAAIAVRTIAESLAGEQAIERVVFACFGSDILGAFQAAVEPVRLRS